MSQFAITVANESHLKFVELICLTIAESAAQRGTGIAQRSPEYIIRKIEEGKAVIAVGKNEEFGGFCYIETWGHGKYVANSGLVVSSTYRHHGLAKRIKETAFKLSRKKYPDAKIFGLTTSLPVMRINADLGYYPVPFSELTTDEAFWKGCQSCVNYDILKSKDFKNCLCTGMMYDPKNNRKTKKWNFIKKSKIYERMIKIKRSVFTQKRKSLILNLFSI
ncbi:MAG: GNAT family N-acetyltransferase [Cyclobacteriaceae bacterium]